MRILDVVLGRTRPVESNLDAIFGLPGAAITLEAAENLVPSGQGGVCYKPAAGQVFAKTADEFRQLLSLSEHAHTTESSDEYGYHWIVVHDADFQSLVNEVHVVNTTLQEQGYGPQLLCSVFGF
ncbi:MAG: PspA-associated protein PspAB, partial [Acidimicrobiales bacterium]